MQNETSDRYILTRGDRVRQFKFIIVAVFGLLLTVSYPGQSWSSDPVDATAQLSQQGSGGIQVYDAAGQYLGVLVGRGRMQDDVTIFIPGLHKFTTIKQSTGEIESASLTFESPDCKGTPYLPGGVDTIFSSAGKYYVGGKQAFDISRVATQTYTGSCVNWSPQYDKLADMFQAIEMPETEIPFTLPVTLPLHYEYE